MHRAARTGSAFYVKDYGRHGFELREHKMSDESTKQDQAQGAVEAASDRAPNMVYCTTCGTQIAVSAESCPKCGAVNVSNKPKTSEKGMVPAALLCFFFGILGFHRFYVGKIGTGILMILTVGGFGIWTLIDFVMIIVGTFKDKEGLSLRR